ncbi:YqgE/AlgH family protein [Agilicoccus flavus]|uniref:YqgE/AlgH family protein n=1 Tax=Agilicoccus flavus TaxID=2775968 RepID=UPI001CF70CB0|nr:YqgE/AlgH family protein [Agilicoccus flavus]
MQNVDSLAGRLLVASPHTGGEIFDRSVVLLLQHSEEGAHGLVLNKPLSAGVERVLPTWEGHLSDPDRLFQGGPVGLDTALGLVSVPGEAEPIGTKLLFGSVGVVDLDAPPELVVPAVAGLRVFAGYSGWSAGQLEGELRAGGWYVVDPEVGDVFTDAPDRLWRSVLRRQGGSLAWVATYPRDPTLN